MNTIASEREGYSFVLSEAKASENAEAVEELGALSPYPGPPAMFSLEKVIAERKWVMYYGGLAWGRKEFNWDSDAWKLSPDYTQKDLAAVDAGTGFSINQLLPTLMDINFDKTTAFRCPVFLFVGSHDYFTSHTLAEAWFRKINAPQKMLIRFGDASHMIMQEEPGRFLQHLVHNIRPIAVSAGDAAPDEVVER